MTIAFIDERSNAYGNKNTWVSSKDVWNNMTLADVDNLPKNSDGVPELPLYGPAAARILKDIDDN